MLIKPIDRVFPFQDTRYKISQTSSPTAGKSVSIIGIVDLTRSLSVVLFVIWQHARIRLSMQRKLKGPGMNLVAAKPCYKTANNLNANNVLRTLECIIFILYHIIN